MENIKEIKIKSFTYYFFNDMINIEDFDLNLPKQTIKNRTKTLVFVTLDTSQFKKLMIMKMFIV